MPNRETCWAATCFADKRNYVRLTSAYCIRWARQISLLERKRFATEAGHSSGQQSITHYPDGARSVNFVRFAGVTDLPAGQKHREGQFDLEHTLVDLAPIARDLLEQTPSPD